MKIFNLIYYNIFIFLEETGTGKDYLIFSEKAYTGEEGLKTLGSIIYLMIFSCAIAFFAFKTLQGLFQYFSASNNPQLKAQYKSDAFEPFKGLVLLSLGAVIINILCQLIFGYNIGLSIF